MRAALLLVGVAACADQGPAALQCGDPVTYRIDRVHLPTTYDETVGFDLDRDGTIDNALGNRNATLIHYDPDFPDLNAVASARLAGDVPWRVVATECADRVRVELGDDGTVPLTVLVDPLGTAPLVAVRPVELHAKVTVTGDELDGVLGFGVPMPESERAMLAPLATYLTGELATGTTVLGKIFDANHDGVVTVDEMLANDLVRTLIAADLDPDRIGEATAFSAGVSFHATRVAP